MIILNLIFFIEKQMIIIQNYAICCKQCCFKANFNACLQICLAGDGIRKQMAWYRVFLYFANVGESYMYVQVFFSEVPCEIAFFNLRQMVYL